MLAAAVAGHMQEAVAAALEHRALAEPGAALREAAPLLPLLMQLQTQAEEEVAAALQILLTAMDQMEAPALSSCLCRLRSIAAQLPARPPSLHRAATPSSSSLLQGATRHEYG